MLRVSDARVKIVDLVSIPHSATSGKDEHTAGLLPAALYPGMYDMYISPPLRKEQT